MTKSLESITKELDKLWIWQKNISFIKFGCETPTFEPANLYIFFAILCLSTSLNSDLEEINGFFGSMYNIDVIPSSL